MPWHFLKANRWGVHALGLGVVLGWAGPLTGTAAEAVSATEKAQYFEDKVKPILAENCFKCHSHNGDRIKGGLVVDSFEALLKGGDTGPAVVPSDLEKSLLIKAVRYTDEDLQMPPKGKKLSAEQVATLEAWVKMGAPGPEGKAAASVTTKARGKITDEDRKWWAFQPVKEPAVPTVKDGGWAKNPIDKFIFEKLAKEGLKPATAADRQTLIRRVYFDLTGLPPSPAEVDAFVNDKSPDAYAKVIDGLLASPRYGERWARHWLDLVRYAESDGYRVDDYRPNVWHYRDYVIKSFNDDKPYDQFVKEQLAGDELWPNSPEALAATAFLRHWIYEYNNRDVRGQWVTILNDVTDVASDVFLGMGLQCARCHDHKFDPLLQKDYYRLQAFFAPILPRQDTVLATPEEKAAYAAKLAKWEEQTTELRGEIAKLEAKYAKGAAKGAIEKFPEDIQDLINKPKAERTPFEDQLAELAYRQVTYEYARLDTKIKADDKDKLEELRRQLKAFDKDKPAPLPTTLTVTDIGPTPPPVFLPKGKNSTPVEPGFLTILDEKPATIHAVATAPNSTGRRTELARWITQPDNQLSTRVIANRVWQYHFGRGLVATASDFGKLGEKPTHPELLDWLTIQFVKGGWSFKQMHRLILMSATYQQSSTPPLTVAAGEKSAALVDPENRLYWRMNTRRLEAEQIRDALYSAAGELDLTMGGPAVDHSRGRRTIYTRVARNVRDPLLDVYDAPENFASMPQRNITTTPTQALLMINSQSMLSRAKAFAMRLQKDKYKSNEELITAAYRLSFGRKPEPTEVRTAMGFLGEQIKRVAPEKPKALPFMAEKMPYREGKAAMFVPKTAQDRFEVPHSESFPDGDFTIEAYVLLHTTYDDASVRTIAAHWDGKKNSPGWSLGVTSKKSANKPQTLVLQLNGEAKGGGAGYEAVFSGLHVDLDKPYYVAASVKLDDTSEAGITFYLKDLSNDCEPMTVVGSKHKITRQIRAKTPFTIGGLQSGQTHLWDGLIDDVRLTGAALKQEQLMLAAEAMPDKCVGYWRFEVAPSVYKDMSSSGNDIAPKSVTASGTLDPQTQALVDFCHVLLNANEFLYVD